MRICIDVQAAVGQRAGVGRYTQRLAQALDSAYPEDDLRLFFFDFKRRGLPFPVARARPHGFRLCPGRAVQQAWKRFGWPPFDRLAGRADVYHFPNFILPPLRRGAAVVTVHDMSFLRYPEFAEARNQAWLAARIRDTVRRADRIVTDSAFSAAEITDLLDVPAERVAAIPLGIGAEFEPQPAERRRAVAAALGLDRPYLLTVGTIEPRKNLPFMIDVFERLDDFDGRLVVAGQLGWKVEPILARIRASSRAADIRLLTGVADEQLPALYAGAELFLITSHYEGFGFPPLEAMACGTPVLASNGGSLPEVLGAGAAIVDAFDADRWAAEARAILTDSAHRARLAAAGRARAAGFTWDATARATRAVYAAALGAP